MINGLFDVSIDTPKYHRRGTLSLKSEGENIAAELKIGDNEVMEFSGTCADKEFDFTGNDDLPSLGQVDYRAHGSVWGNSLSITCETDAGKVEIFGTRLSTQAGELKSSHEYMMAASTGDARCDDGIMYSGLYADGG